MHYGFLILMLLLAKQLEELGIIVSGSHRTDRGNFSVYFLCGGFVYTTFTKALTKRTTAIIILRWFGIRRKCME